MGSTPNSQVPQLDTQGFCKVFYSVNTYIQMTIESHHYVLLIHHRPKHVPKASNIDLYFYKLLRHAWETKVVSVSLVLLTNLSYCQGVVVSNLQKHSSRDNLCVFKNNGGRAQYSIIRAEGKVQSTRDLWGERTLQGNMEITLGICASFKAIMGLFNMIVSKPQSVHNERHWQLRLRASTSMH